MNQVSLVILEFNDRRNATVTEHDVLRDVVVSKRT